MVSATLAPADDRSRCPKYSTRFRRAAAAEHARLIRKRDRAVGRATRTREELDSNEQEVSELDREISALQKIADDEATHFSPPPPPPEGAHLLSRRDIREVAVRLLVDAGDRGQPVHYKAWLQRLRDAGYEVAGKRPEAVFLGQVSRSPVVKATERPGFYEVDPGAADALRGEICDLRERLVALAAEEPSSAASLADQASRTQTVSLDIRRAERALDEAVRTAEERTRPHPSEQKGARGETSTRQYVHA
jgi:hypothetical protein